MALDATLRSKLVDRGTSAEAEPWPELLATSYAAYVRTGDRARFEVAYLGRRRKLNALVMAELAEAQGRFLDAIADGAWLLCEESGWQLPAHNAQGRGGARAPLPDTSDPVLDLFAAETGGLLATVLSIMGEELEHRLPGLALRVLREIEARILGPYLTRPYWWMGHIDGPTSNWTVWITQNVLLAGLTVPMGAARRRALVARAVRSLDAFLADHGEDGACEEGALYYRHAGLCLWGALELLSRTMPEAIAPVWQVPKLRNVAEYIEAVHVAGRHYANFADCPAVNERCTIREVLFGRAVGSERLEAFARRDAAADGWDDLPDEINLWYRMLQALHAEELTAALPPSPNPCDVWFPDAGILVARDGRFTLAAKAGDNGDSHNHNDVGSVTLYKDVRPVLIDIGVETYTAKTFSPQRYEIWTMQSAWHNLPTFGGIMQAAGEGYAARDVRAQTSHDSASLEMELAGAWPETARLRSFRRRVELLRGQRVVIEDEYDGDLPAELSLLFAVEPRVDVFGLDLRGLARIGVEGGEELRTEFVPIVDPRLKASWPDGIWRVLIAVPGRRLRLDIA
jgi:hypothetical protein